MNNFVFYNPVKVYFGPGQFKELGNITSNYGKKALMLKTTGPIEKTGIYDRATEYLENAGIKVYELKGVTPNPKLSKVLEGAEICKKEGIDIVLGIGGGTAIDGAKGVAFAAKQEGDLWDFFTRKRIATESLPVGAVTTIAGTGAEMNVNCTVTNEETQEKFGVHYEMSFPKFAIIDPVLQTSLPKLLTANGMADTISHVMETYFDGTEDTPIQDRLGEGIMLTVIENQHVLDNPNDITARGNLAWAATLAINGLHDAGRGGLDWDAHIIEHEVSAKYDIPHGVGMAVVHPAWLEHQCKQNPKKFVQFAKRVFGIDKGNKTDMEVGMEGIKALKDEFVKWGLPSTLRELGVEKDILPKLAQDATKNPEGQKLNPDDVLKVLNNCY